MKRLLSILFCCILLLTLAGCRKLPDKTLSGEEWNDAWIRIGTVLGVGASPENFELIDNKDALSVSDLYYSEWACGKPREYINSEGETASVYDAQIYLLLRETNNRELAENTAEEWENLTKKNYDITDSFTKEYSEQEFSVYKYNVINENNPYAFGISAFGVWESGAVSVEFVFMESFTDNADEILNVFLTGLHYA